MGQRQCWSCGGQMSSYASRCSWCGRSGAAGTAMQLVGLGAALVAVVILAGVVPWADVRAFAGLDPPVSPMMAAVEPAELRSSGAPVAAGSGAAATSARTGSRERPAGGAPRRADQDRVVSTAVASDAAAPEESCSSPASVALLGRAHPGWSAAELALIGCGRVRAGFTTAQVEAAKGRPREVRPDEGAGPREEWVYTDATIEIEEGRVTAVR